jgi:hypothetical protein
MRFTLAIGAILSMTGISAAQYPTQPYPSSPYYPPQNSGNYLPNYYDPQYQPLSPYLNLMRGGNPATNYYYGVKPGTLGVGPRATGGVPFVASGGNRMLFFPQLASAPDPTAAPVTSAGSVLPPAGHPVVFNNTMGFFPSPFGQAGGSRAGLAGLGAAGRRR